MWIFHPLVGLGYQFWSGIEGAVPQVAGLAVLFSTYKALHYHFECHASECHRWGFHRVEGTHYRTCWHDHPVLSKHPRHSVPVHIIHQQHHQALEGAIKVKEGDQ